MARTAIEWTESTWNPVTGCSKVSAGCSNCYAERLAWRLQAMGNPNYARGFEVSLHEHMLALPSTWRKPQMIFVNSMSDLFHADVPAKFIHRVFEAMNHAGWHRFQVLTKRSRRLLEMDSTLQWADHVWMGVSVENSDCRHRIDALRQTSAGTKFLSLEPLLGPLPEMDLRGIDWVIVGGESGPGARPIRAEWVTDIRDQCLDASVAFFFKQWGGVNKKKAGRLLEGRVWGQIPNRDLSSPSMVSGG